LLEPRTLACDQELGCGIVEALALQLPDRGAEFENLGAQLENPVRLRVFLYRALPKLSAARDHSQGFDGCLDRTQAHAVANIRQDIPATGRLPFADQQGDLPAQIHLRQRLLRAVAITIDKAADGGLDISHLQPQGTDFTSNSINSVVHGLLEQNKNI
jgi:hypothetical protein